MFLAMGVGAYAAGIFHLYTHAFFKALLFLGSGAIIHALGGEQDLRRMGGLKRELPLTYATFLVGALAIAGVPGLAGFFSKDEILFRAYAGGHLLLWAMALVTSLLTAVYMFRVVFLAFYGQRVTPGPAAHPGPEAHPEEPEAHPEEEEAAARGHGAHLHDPPPAMAVALVVLAVGSVAAGWVGGSFERFLEPSLAAPVAEAAAGESGEAGEAGHGTELALMALSSIVALGGIGLAVHFFLRRPEEADRLAREFPAVHRLLERKYLVDEFYSASIVRPLVALSDKGLWRGVDVRVIDGAVNGVAKGVEGASGALRMMQTGSVRAYAASLFFGVVMVLGYYLWK
jgi:NADH-quinone oxidoreductase subunit L